jgi:hypothetical protein
MFEDILEGWEDLLVEPDGPVEGIVDERFNDWDTGLDWGDIDIIWNT